MRTERKLRGWNLALVEIQGCRVSPCYYLPLSSCVCLERCCAVSSGKHSVLFICFHVQICLRGEKRREALCKLNLCWWAEERLQTHGVWVFLPPGTYGCLLPRGCSGRAPVQRWARCGYACSPRWGISKDGHVLRHWETQGRSPGRRRQRLRCGRLGPPKSCGWSCVCSHRGTSVFCIGSVHFSLGLIPVEGCGSRWGPGNRLFCMAETSPYCSSSAHLFVPRFPVVFCHHSV